MKKNKNFKDVPLMVDVVEYAFVEWLIRRNLYPAFRVNYDHTPTARETFRDCLRRHILYLCCESDLGPGSLISSAFLFHSTPEGYQFWLNHSEAWKRFLASFLK